MENTQGKQYRSAIAAGQFSLISERGTEFASPRPRLFEVFIGDDSQILESRYHLQRFCIALDLVKLRGMR